MTVSKLAFEQIMVAVRIPVSFKQEVAPEGVKYYLTAADTKAIVKDIGYIFEDLAWYPDQELAVPASKLREIACWLRNDWWRYVGAVWRVRWNRKPQCRGKAVRRACMEYKLYLE